MSEPDVLLERILGVRRFSRDGHRAPHKPLLLLYVLGQLQRSGSSAVRFVDAEPVIDELLIDFGRSTTRSTTAYPFHHLQSDGFWEVDGAPTSSSPAQLRSADAKGHFTAEFESTLRKDPRLLALAVRSILEANFPASLHDDICSAIGIEIEALEVTAARARAAALRRRDPHFRDRVLVAYEYRCAMCGYDGAIGREAVALDAAHIRWWAFDGPDEVENSLCLCSLHHKLFDRGAVGVDLAGRVAVSQRFIGRSPIAQELVLSLAGRDLHEPQRGQPPPAADFIEWHGNEVFRHPART